MADKIKPQDYLAFIEAQLNAYFCQFPDDKARLSVLLQQIAAGDEKLCQRSNLPGHLTASALVLDPNNETLLLIRHKFLQRWLQPGGHLDPLEMPLAGAFRELAEEVGPLPVTLHPWHEAHKIPIDLDSHRIPANPNKGEQEHFHHDFQYAMVLDGKSSVELQVDEVSGYRWVPYAEFAGGEFGQRLSRTVRKMQMLGFLKSGVLS